MANASRALRSRAVPFVNGCERGTFEPPRGEAAMQQWSRISVAAAIVLAAGLPVTAGERGARCVVEVRIQWIDVLDLAPFAFRTAAAEARRVLAEEGICAALARASPASVRTKDEIGIILLRSMAGSGRGRRVLGATRSQDPGNASVWIYVDEVTATLGLSGRAAYRWTGLERLHAGRALGRVAAHEIVHVLLPNRPHDEAGLMAPSFGRRELMASTFPQGGRQIAAAPPLPY